jgi:voltage-gated potassium channel Kch
VIARTQLRELFTAAALLLVIGIALLMDAVGLSPALGTFLAGVVLANSEYRHELESDIEPFKGLMLGLFFIAVGASIDFGLVAAQPGVIAAIVGSLILLKFVILVVLGRLFRLSLDQNLVFAFSLAQAGEFGFVLISFSVQEGVVDATVAAPVVASIALTMALTPVLMLINERLVQPRVGTRRTEERAPDEMDEQTPVIIAGYGRFGSVVGRLLSANGVEATVLDNDSDQVDLLRRMGLKVFYGDATRHDLLAAAGANQARLLVLALDSPERNLALCHTARKHFPHLRVMARAAGWDDAHELEVAGAEHVYRETLDASLRLGADALSLLGQRAYHAIRAARKFRRHDEEVVRNLAAMRDDRAAYLDTAREHIRELEELLRSDLAERTDDVDAGWDTETLMEDARSGWVKDSEADEDGRE